MDGKTFEVTVCLRKGHHDISGRYLLQVKKFLKPSHVIHKKNSEFNVDFKNTNLPFLQNALVKSNFKIISFLLKKKPKFTPF
jgi:hypothetical protein